MRLSGDSRTALKRSESTPRRFRKGPLRQSTSGGTVSKRRNSPQNEVRRGWLVGPGALGGYRAVFGRPKAESRRPVIAVRVDGTYVRRAGVSQQGLRRSLETIDGESPFVEDATFDNAWDSLRDGANALVQQPLRASLFPLNTEIGNHDRVLENRGGPSRSGDGSSPVRYRRHETGGFVG
jgi:hypothetical protein